MRNASVIRSGLIGRKSEVTAHVRGVCVCLKSGESGPRPLRSVNPVAALTRNHPTLAPTHLPAPNNSRRPGSRRALPNCFPSLFPRFRTLLMSGRRGLWQGWGGVGGQGGHFYQTKIPTGDPWRSKMQEKGTSLGASKAVAVCGGKSEDVLTGFYGFKAEVMSAFIGFHHFITSPSCLGFIQPS